VPIKTILFLGAFLLLAAGALFEPLLGVIGYMFNYIIGATSQWWAEPIRYWGIRYSFILALATAIGMLLNSRKLRYGRTFLLGQEKLLLVFLAVMWFSTLLGEPTVGTAYVGHDHPSLKMTKVILFTLMLTHLVTTARTVNLVFWVLTVGGLVLGLQAYGAPASSFEEGRLESIGSPDFAEANFCAAYLAATLPIIGVQFLRTGWLGKAVCLVSGVFVANGIVLMRSRGAVVGLAAGVLAALVMAPKRFRLAILAGIIVAAAGGYYLTNPKFLERAGTISATEEERDASAASRLDIWSASLAMWEGNPLGIGAGNFYQTIGRYLPQLEGRDTHNTYLKCLCELGIQGIIIFAVVIVNAVLVLRRVTKQAQKLSRKGEHNALLLQSYGLIVAIVVLLAAALTITFLYIEALWWLLAMPVCLERALENAIAEGKATVPTLVGAGASGGASTT
jgi:O-antigen ligase